MRSEIVPKRSKSATLFRNKPIAKFDDDDESTRKNQTISKTKRVQSSINYYSKLNNHISSINLTNNNNNANNTNTIKRRRLKSTPNIRLKGKLILSLLFFFIL